MEPQITLRTAADRDVAFIVRLIDSTMRSYIEKTWGSFSRELVEQRVRDAVVAGTYSIVQLASEDIGALAVEHEPSHVQLAQIYILPTHQNRGIGTRLIRQVVAQTARSAKPLRVRVLSVNPARRLYEREGFVVTSTTAERFFMEKNA